MFSSWVFFIAGFVQLDIKVIVVRIKNRMSSNHTFLSIARNGVFQILILKHYEKCHFEDLLISSCSVIIIWKTSFPLPPAAQRSTHVMLQAHHQGRGYVFFTKSQKSLF